MIKHLKKNYKRKGSTIDYLIEFSSKLGKLDESLDNLKTHFSNHLHNHKIDRTLQAVYFLVVVMCFCYLKWGS